MRKKYILVFAALIFNYLAQSQITKGNWLVGGSGELYSYKGDDIVLSVNRESKYTEIEFSLQTGYFIADKTAAGIRGSFSSIKGSTTINGGSTNTQRYLFGPFVRYYLLSLENNYNIIGDLSYQFGKNDFDGSIGESNAFSITVGPVIYFNSSVGLEVLLGYSSRKEEMKDYYISKRSGFQTSIGLQIHLEKD